MYVCKVCRAEYILYVRYYFVDIDVKHGKRQVTGILYRICVWFLGMVSWDWLLLWLTTRVTVKGMLLCNGKWISMRIITCVKIVRRVYWSWFEKNNKRPHIIHVHFLIIWYHCPHLAWSSASNVTYLTYLFELSWVVLKSQDKTRCEGGSMVHIGRNNSMSRVVTWDHLLGSPRLMSIVKVRMRITAGTVVHSMWWGWW